MPSFADIRSTVRGTKPFALRRRGRGGNYLDVRSNKAMLSENQLRSEVDQALEYFVTACLPKLKSIPASLDPQDVEGLPVRAVPSHEFNLIATGEFAAKVGSEVMLSFPGLFYQCGDCWFLRSDWKYSHCGLIVPIRSRGAICSLRVFRSASDRRPFELRARERLAA
jgi:hypothetical protein